VTLLAVFLQALVVQTHIHGPALLSGGYEERAALGFEQQADAADEHQVSCALCQTLAAAGSATLPTDVSAIEADRTSQAAILAVALAPRPHTHSWQSRAPPTLL
jgi:hypothetical protein